MSETSTSSTRSRKGPAKLCTPSKRAKKLLSAVRLATNKNATEDGHVHATTKTTPTAEISKRAFTSSKDRAPTGRPPVIAQLPMAEPPMMETLQCPTPESSDAGSSTSNAVFYSADSSPRLTLEGEVEARPRRSSESDLSRATSTPGNRITTGSENPKPRSESSLLRIKAQLRAAAAADLETSVRHAEEPRDEGRGDESYISDISAIGGGSLHDMPRLANALLQKSKARLEGSRNLHRDIKEDVTSGMHGLYEMVLRLADSRNRHIAEKEKQRAGYERRLGQLETRHATALASLLSSHREAQRDILEAVKAAHKEAETARWLFLEAEEANKENAKKIANLANKLDGTPEGFSNHEMRTIQEDIAMLRLELGTLNMATLEGSQRPGESSDLATSAAVEGIRREMERFRKEVGGANAFGGSDITHQDEDQARPSYSDMARNKPGATDPLSYTHSHSGTQQPDSPLYPLMVESADPRDTSDDVVSYIKSNVDVIELGVGVNSIRKRKNQKVVIACDSMEDRFKLESAIKSSSQKLTVSQLKARNPLLRLTGVVKDTSDRQVEEAIIRQNSGILVDLNLADRQVKVIRSTKGRTNEVRNVIVEANPTLHRLLKGRKLKIGYQVIHASDQSPIIQCYQCLGYGHLARECRNPVTCGHCADQHDTRQCTRRSESPKCTNCRGSGGGKPGHGHAAYSTECPEWRKWDRIARSSVSYC